MVACQDCHGQNTFALADAESFGFGFLASLSHLQQLAMNAIPCIFRGSIMAVHVAFLTFAYEQSSPYQYKLECKDTCVR